MNTLTQGGRAVDSVRCAGEGGASCVAQQPGAGVTDHCTPDAGDPRVIVAYASALHSASTGSSGTAGKVLQLHYSSTSAPLYTRISSTSTPLYTRISSTSTPLYTLVISAPQLHHVHYYYYY